MPKKTDDIEWEITEVRSRGRFLGWVRAATLDQAIEAAVKEFELAPERAKRLVARRRG